MSTLSGLGERGILFFPVTPFGPDDTPELDVLGEHIENGISWAPDAVFVACGTGEYPALTVREYRAVVARAVETVAGRVPVISGAGYTAAIASEYIANAAAAGADGVLLFPPLGPSTQYGLVRHYETVAARSELPIVLYQRDGIKLTPDTVRRLLDVPNIVGLKDGTGDLERLSQTVLLARDRWTFFNGMPTAELSARAYGGVGVRPYSSAVFAFLPELATAFRRALADGDDATTELMLREFYGPLGQLRDKAPGYAVSLVKAGVSCRGLAAGPVRAPLPQPSDEHVDALRRLIELGLGLAETSGMLV